MAALLVAAPSIVSAINDFRDPIVQQGQPPLRKSHLTRIALACTGTLAAVLTLEEELALEGIVQQAWIQQDATSMQAFLSLADHAATAQTAQFSEWWEKSTALLLHLGKHQQANGSFMHWVNRVHLRRSVGSEVIPATDLRKAIADSKTLPDRTAAAKAEIAKLRKEIETLQLDIAGREETLLNEEREVADAQKHLEARLASDRGGIENALRRHFVRNKAQFKDFYIQPNIPDHKLANARAACSVPASEKVIALFDLTVFGSAKDAVVFGEAGIYFRAPQPTLMTYPNLSGYDINGGGNITFVNRKNTRYTYRVAGMLTRDCIVEALQGVQRLLA